MKTDQSISNIIEREKMKRLSISDEHITRYIFACNEISKSINSPKIIDVACGQGFGSFLCASLGGEVVGVDLSANQLNVAREEFSGANITYIEANTTSLPLGDDEFDAAVSLETIEHLDQHEQEQYLGELKRVVRQGGVIIISTPDHEVWQNEGLSQHDHKKELTKSELQQLLNKYFSNIQLYGMHVQKDQGLLKKGLRKLLIFIKKIDILGLRYKLLPSTIRRSVDIGTIGYDHNEISMPIKLGGNQCAMDMIAVCKNSK